MEDLTRWWEIPCIGQFASLFRFAFNLPEMDIEELEEGFIADGAPGGSMFLQDLLISLIRGFYPKRRIGRDNWQDFLWKVAEKRWGKIPKKSFRALNADFSELSLRTKVEIVYNLCLHRLDCKDVIDAMKSMDADALRVQSLGCDSHGNVYWYFYGTRLYMEEPAKNSKRRQNWKDQWNEVVLNGKVKKKGPGRPRKKKLKSDGESEDVEDSYGLRNGFLTLDSSSRWSVVCTTLDDWEKFAERFSKSKVKCEVSLYSIIKKNFLPALSAVYEEKEKRLKRKSAELSSQNLPSWSSTKKKKTEVNPADNSLTDDKSQSQQELEDASSADRTRSSKGRQRTAGEKKFIPDAFKVAPSHTEKAAGSGSEKHIMDRNLHLEYDLYPKLSQVLTTVKLHKDAWPFLNPVDESIAPGYYDIIQNPVDLSTIERKIRLKAYQTVSQIDLDFRRMVTNSQIYNGERNCYTEMARTLWRTFRKGISQISLNQKCIGIFGKSTSSESQEECIFGSKKLSSQSAAGKKSQEKAKQSAKKRRRKRRNKGRLPNMEGLEMLAEASEQALKGAEKSETNLFLSAAEDLAALSASNYPDLKVSSTQNHPPSLIAKYSSEDSDCSQKSALSPASTGSCDRNAEIVSEVENQPESELTKVGAPGASACSPDSSFCEKSLPLPILEPEVNHESMADNKKPSDNAHEAEEALDWPRGLASKNMSPDSCNHIQTPRSSSRGSSSSERSSNADAASDSSKNLSELDLTCRVLGISGDITKADALSNLSSLLCRIIKENQELHSPDSQSSMYPEGSAVSNCSKSSPNGASLLGCGSANRSPLDSQSFYAGSSPGDQSMQSASQYDIPATFHGSGPLRNITTVDASVLGLSTDIGCRAQSCAPQCTLPELDSRYENFQSFQGNAVATDNLTTNSGVESAEPVAEKKSESGESAAPSSSGSHFSHLSEALRDLTSAEEEYAESLQPKDMPSLGSNLENCSSNENAAVCEQGMPSTVGNVADISHAGQDVHVRADEKTESRSALPELGFPGCHTGVSSASSLPSSSFPVQVPVATGSVPMFFGQTQPVPVNFPVNGGPVTVVPPLPQQAFKPCGAILPNVQAPAVAAAAAAVSVSSDQGCSTVKSPVTHKGNSNKQSRKKKKKVSSAESEKVRIQLSSPPSVSSGGEVVQSYAAGCQSAISTNVNVVKIVHCMPYANAHEKENDMQYQNLAVSTSNGSFKSGVWPAVSGIAKDSSTSAPLQPQPVFAPYGVSSSLEAARFSSPESSSIWNQSYGSTSSIPYSSMALQPSSVIPTSSGASSNPSTFAEHASTNSSGMNGDRLSSYMFLSSGASTSLSSGNASENHDPKTLAAQVTSIPVSGTLSNTTSYNVFPFFSPYGRENGAKSSGQHDFAASSMQEQEKPGVQTTRGSDDAAFQSYVLGPRLQPNISVTGQQMPPHRYFSIPPPAPVMIPAQPSLHTVPQMPFFPSTSVSSLQFPMDSISSAVNGSGPVPVMSRTLPVYTILPNPVVKGNQN